MLRQNHNYRLASVFGNFNRFLIIFQPNDLLGICQMAKNENENYG